MSLYIYIYIYAIEIEHIEKYATLNLALINYVINNIHRTSFLNVYEFFLKMKLEILSHNSIFGSCGNSEFSITFKIPCQKIYNDEAQIEH